MKTTGGGSPPNPPEPSEEMALAASMMSEELAMGSDVCDTMDMQFGDAIRIGKFFFHFHGDFRILHLFKLNLKRKRVEL